MTLGRGPVTDHSIRVRKGTKPLNNSRKPLSDLMAGFSLRDTCGKDNRSGCKWSLGCFMDNFMMEVLDKPIGRCTAG